MKILISFIIVFTLLCIPLYFVYANDRKESDYIFYKAELSSIDKSSKLTAGTVDIKMDIDHTYIFINIKNLNVSSPIQSISIHGPSINGEKAPVIFIIDRAHIDGQKISITEDQAADIAHELYYIEIATKNNPNGEAKGKIIRSSAYMPRPYSMKIDFKKIGEDIARYINLITSKTNNSKSTIMNMNEESTIHSLPQNVINQLKHNHPTILATYSFYKIIPDYKTIAYMPRQFDAGLMFESSRSAITDASIYKGWDFLNTPTDEQSQSVITPKWLTLQLYRNAQIGIIWRGGQIIPQWLTSWKKSLPVAINYVSYPVYVKKVSSKEINLQTGNYLILFAEESGKPSSPPVIPSGLEAVRPNTLCPSWVHDQYVTKGPDGEWYASWHPQIDPVYWCYFGHEHGSDPKIFDQNVSLPFGYAGVKMGMHEKHQGFKVYIWDDKYGYRFLVLQHQGTSSNQAVCGRYHELDFFVKDTQKNEILAKRYFVGDYGISRSLVSGKPFENSKCPDQKSTQSSGARFLPIESERKTTEAWVVDKKNIIGFNFADFVVSALDSVRMCKNYTCDSIIITKNTGSLREISYVTGLGPYSGIGYSGTFYTGPTGTSLTSSKDPIAVEQYTKPGISVLSDLPQSVHLYNSTHCYDVEGFGSLFTCGVSISAAPTMRENSITVPN